LRRRARRDPKDTHRPGNVFQWLLADVFEGEVELARGVLLHASRDADAARLREAFEPSGDVDAVAKDVAVLNDDVSNINANAELDPIFGRSRHIAFSHCSLNFDGAAQCVDDTDKLDQ
jgi:hypothetical protein